MFRKITAKTPQNKFSREIQRVSHDYPLVLCEKVDGVPLVTGREQLSF
jgi:hypothetical protein